MREDLSWEVFLMTSGPTNKNETKPRNVTKKVSLFKREHGSGY